MIKEDFVIQATVRRLLVRSNIDHSDLTFGTVRGVVYFRGIFKLGRIYIYGEDEKTLFAKSQDYIRKTLYSLEKKVRSIPGVRDVILHVLRVPRSPDDGGHPPWGLVMIDFVVMAAMTTLSGLASREMVRQLWRPKHSRTS